MSAPLGRVIAGIHPAIPPSIASLSANASMACATPARLTSQHRQPLFSLNRVMKYKFYSSILWRKNVICVVFSALH
ncbi:hypothetical protein D4M71_02290 [Klebsiella quasipneumoniae]|nr:hypothetical protein F9C06_08330 [Klebsiella quasipneumoniae]RTD80605.1 hypothetical protein EJ896_02480 [Klebsiella quasipneumoniae subsp. similipneumoniae]TXV42532.1 hypothetical protein D4M71_02290 [Klebsiella quasipneumoniae]TXV77939.1 hypothetical protein D4M73_00450 [Klebsiella quasipneumoniae]TXW65857.1 hypothetical protein D4M67_03415 [Klebsiella quasipneumoniae]